jgi:hypothetical protein
LQNKQTGSNSYDINTRGNRLIENAQTTRCKHYGTVQCKKQNIWNETRDLKTNKQIPPGRICIAYSVLLGLVLNLFYCKRNHQLGESQATDPVAVFECLISQSMTMSMFVESLHEIIWQQTSLSVIDSRPLKPSNKIQIRKKCLPLILEGKI